MEKTILQNFPQQNDFRRLVYRSHSVIRMKFDNASSEDGAPLQLLAVSKSESLFDFDWISTNTVFLEIVSTDRNFEFKLDVTRECKWDTIFWLWWNVAWSLLNAILVVVVHRK